MYWRRCLVGAWLVLVALRLRTPLLPALDRVLSGISYLYRILNGETRKRATTQEPFNLPSFVKWAATQKPSKRPCGVTGAATPKPTTLRLLVRQKDVMVWRLPVLPISRLASETALVPVSPALHTDSTDHSHGCAVPDGLPSESPVHADGLPSSAVSESSSLLDRIFQKKYRIWYLRDFHTGESSESLRQSQLDQVQIVPAT